MSKEEDPKSGLNYSSGPFGGRCQGEGIDLLEEAKSLKRKKTITFKPFVGGCVHQSLPGQKPGPYWQKK